MKIVTSPEKIENDRITDSVLDDIKSIIQSTKNKDIKIRISIFSLINLTSFYCDIHNLSSSGSKYMPVLTHYNTLPNILQDTNFATRITNTVDVIKNVHLRRLRRYNCVPQHLLNGNSILNSNTIRARVNNLCLFLKIAKFLTL